MANTHYYTDNRNLPSNRKEHSFRFSSNSYIFVTDDGVFSKSGVDYGTQVLLEAAIEESLQGDVLDLGCGYGVVSAVIGKHFPQCSLTACDINSRAVELTKENCMRNGIDVKALVSDSFTEIPDSFDAVLTNPPIRTGKKVIYGMFEDSYKHLNVRGILMVVIRRQQGAESALKKIQEVFGNCEVVSRDRGYWVLKAIKLPG